MYCTLALISLYLAAARAQPVGTQTAAGPTTTTTRTTSAPATTTSASSGTAPHYGQCGGIGWTGPTVCAAPYKCVKVYAPADYYSQCL